MEISDIPRPPAIYRHEPKQWYGVYFVPWQDVKENCKMNVDIPVACTAGVFIFIRDDLPEHLLPRVLEHEKGHVNGWRHP